MHHSIIFLWPLWFCNFVDSTITASVSKSKGSIPSQRSIPETRSKHESQHSQWRMETGNEEKQSFNTHQAQLAAGKSSRKDPPQFLCLQGGEVPPHGGELEVGRGWDFGRARGADRGSEDGAGARGAGGWSCGAQGIRQPHGWWAGLSFSCEVVEEGGISSSWPGWGFGEVREPRIKIITQGNSVRAEYFGLIIPVGCSLCSFRVPSAGYSS